MLASRKSIFGNLFSSWSTEPEARRREFFGAAIVTIVGLFLASLFIVSVNIWVIFLPVPGFPALAAIVGGVTLGKWLARKNLVPSVPLWVTIVVLIFGVPLSCYAPYSYRTMRLERLASAIPTYPGANLVKTDIEPISGDTPGGFTLCFQTDSEPGDVAQFYRRRFSSDGFIEVAHLHGSGGDNFCKEGYCVEFSIGTSKQNAPRPPSWFSPGSGSTWFQFEYDRW